MAISKRIKYILTALLAFVLLVVISGQASLSAFSVNAETTVSYSNVLDDLKRDPDFDESEYPAVANDYSVKVITIAEGNKGELFVYVYQPCNDSFDLRCTKISISVGFSDNGENLNPDLYDLELVSTSGVFDKYLVKDIPIPNETVHYYNVVEILRNFNSLIDTSIENGETDSKAYAVGQQYCCYVKDGTLVYESTRFKTLAITPTINGNIFYGSGFSFNDILGVEDRCNSHFLAFNVDGIIDENGKKYDVDVRHIFDADVTYLYREVKTLRTITWVAGVKTGDVTATTYPNGEDFVPKKVTLRDTQTVSYQGEGLFAKEFTWKRIMTAKEYIASLEKQDVVFNEESKKKINESQYVFCFAETDNTDLTASAYSPDGFSEYYYSGETYTEVAEVGVLRIHFMDLYDTYDLGVVSDFTTSDNIPDGSASGVDLDKILDPLKMLIALVGLLFIVNFLSPFLSPIISLIFNAIWKGLRTVVQLVLKIVTFPLRLIFGLFKEK